MDIEKRTSARLAFHAKACIHWNNQDVEGQVENVSVDGAFVTAAFKMRINDVVALTINDTPTVGINAKVVRLTNTGMGLKFEKTLHF
ncbi:PilZ domain-containing protein [Geomonas sp. Red69]|uniref:PilZ domain-containing protein n=1 Tax=Geomonas diazotrophica TaxID=2843197 RepID=A0ABX8JKQ6_9BACT|nr:MULTISPECIES: PilZ domain-containing protein [Geomonas]MBU5636534.1 PilZ domain-containing protein [Geomonas diazotrophica]QWV98963.1 PilZ domain-containing protein [Geomonas nitrogeniifigens]QXE88129.1 PilZ domain-containing protein [Geomonas nitrogeniifigens]